MNDMTPEAEAFIKSLGPDDIKWLQWLLTALKRVDGWCRINRFIGRYLILGAIAVIVLMSNGYDALARFISFLRGH